jgi:hypothetical protein
MSLLARQLTLLLVLMTAMNISAQWIENKTPTYPELIDYLKKISNQHKEIELYDMGPSDYGLPIYLCIVNGAGDSLKTFDKARNGTTLLINNAIHAGEPDGVNACLLWLDEWIKTGKKIKNIPLVAFIPAYNVGGMMNRSGDSRANQNGPEEYGFRGNAQNLDLNRDFIKMDAQNTRIFSLIFHALNPDVFVDTHVSNGADYQYTLTYISSLKERMAPSIRTLTYDQLLPDLTAKLKQKQWDLFPYVEMMKETPDEGIHAFNDLPRYAMGYSSLFDAISFTVETHMLKPFPERVKATYDFLAELVNYISINKEKIEFARKEATDFWLKRNFFNFSYKLNDVTDDSILFKGYTARYSKSDVTGLPRLFYDRTTPYQKNIPYYQSYSSKDSIRIPKYFIVGSQCEDVLSKLNANQVKMKVLEKDTLLDCLFEHVIDFKSPDKPYEGHYYHGDVKTEYKKERRLFKKGDVFVEMNQPARNYVLASLVSRAEDSFFRWNAFDSYLQQKEYFSPYVFEEKAAQLLKENEMLRQEFELLRATNEAFKNSQWEQLYFIYKNSEMFEESYRVLPIFLVD